MTTVTIPRGLTEQKDLIAIPRSTYEGFLAWQKAIKSKKTFTPTASEKRAIAKARKDFANGKYIKWEDLKHELGLNN